MICWFILFPFTRRAFPCWFPLYVWKPLDPQWMSFYHCRCLTLQSFLSASHRSISMSIRQHLSKPAAATFSSSICIYLFYSYLITTTPGSRKYIHRKVSFSIYASRSAIAYVDRCVSDQSETALINSLTLDPEVKWTMTYHIDLVGLELIFFFLFSPRVWFSSTRSFNSMAGSLDLGSLSDPDKLALVRYYRNYNYAARCMYLEDTHFRCHFKTRRLCLYHSPEF